MAATPPLVHRSRMDTSASSHPATVRVDALLREAATRIGREDAEPLLMHALGVDRAWLFAHAGDPVEAPEAGRYRALVARREAGEPVAYLSGRRGFWTLDLEVTADTLIPRPETELLVELALARIDPDAPARIADRLAERILYGPQ